jgi:LPS sulfotransferase NodH
MGYYFRPQVTSFVILFVERSGSTYLATLLDSHPQVHALREQFATLKQEGADAQQQLEWADNFYTPPWIGRNKALGFKTKYIDILNPDGFVQVLEKHKTRIIVLLRRNAVKAVVSTINARRLWEKTGNWNLLNETDRRPAVAINPKEFEQLLELREKWDQEIVSYAEQLSLPRMILYYEEMLIDENAFMNKVYSFINVENKPAHGTTLKNTRDNLREAVSNYEELRARFAGTVYEPMFDEVLINES